MAYDVFISYRRSTGADDARLLQQALKARGYEVFFDYDSLRDGQFNEKIYEAIGEAPVFILMMTAGALDRCAEEGDWVRNEIERALSKGRHVVPVAPSSQKWAFPDELPASLVKIRNTQVSELNKASLFEQSVDKIVEDRFPAEMRRKHKAVDSIHTTVASPSAVFVGRETELAGLHEMLAAGKFPVITGAGGTGKSELARQYAACYKADYPGGLFQIDMEAASSWDVALVDKLLVPSSAPGYDVLGTLGIRQEKEDSGRKELLNAGDVIAALNQRARQSGRILLLLDNVESARIFLREPVLAKLSFDADIRLLATARAADVAFRPDDRCLEFPLRDLLPEAALNLLLRDHPADSDAERAAAEKIAESLGFRALYLRAIPALLDDVYSPYEGSYVELADALKGRLLETVGEGMEEADDSARTPAALWELTSKSLLAQPRGAVWIKLARIAAHFSPNGFPTPVLRHLWGDLAQPSDNTDRAFEQALLVLQKHGLLAKKENMLFMHRLTRAAILGDLEMDGIKLQEEIGKSLNGYLRASRDIWLLLADFPAVLSHAPETLQNGDFFVGLLFANPKCAEICQWEKLDSRDWRRLLLEQPQFADKCDWSKLNGNDWVNLLGGDLMDFFGSRPQPQFADKCDWSKLNGNDWASLLVSRPQFADKCDWSKLNGNDWTNLLGGNLMDLRGSQPQPQFEEKCDWSKLDGNDWASLLVSQPQFADKCDWSKLNGNDWTNLLGGNLGDLRGSQPQPQFAEKCPWEKFDGNAWASLLVRQPQFAGKCDWSRLHGSNWAILLGSQPQFADKCPWEKFDGNDWAIFLGSQPQFADKCLWEKFDGNDWAILLGSQPQFADKCDWSKLDGNDWASLLVSQPQFMDKCLWEKFDGNDWASLLVSQPQFMDKCPWEKFDGSSWAILVAWQPQFADKCHWEKFDSYDWAILLGSQPQFADKCPWEKFDGQAWTSFLCRQPQFADKCDWSKLNGNDWANLLGGDLMDFFDSRPQPQFADKCDWLKLDGEDWSWLLGSLPQFADKCDWSKLGGYAWAILLGRQPQFADKCDWLKLVNEDWASLLCSQPQFADKCPWEKFDGQAWVWLLCVQPQFADKCDWSKLSDEDWDRLLSEQPQLADRCVKKGAINT